MTDAQIAKIVDGLGGLLGVLQNADPTDRAEIYARVGLQMTYRPGTQTVIAEVTHTPTRRSMVCLMCVRGRTHSVAQLINPLRTRLRLP
jgi:site-specific DNA recombinase